MIFVITMDSNDFHEFRYSFMDSYYFHFSVDYRLDFNFHDFRDSRMDLQDFRDVHDSRMRWKIFMIVVVLYWIL